MQRNSLIAATLLAASLAIAPSMGAFAECAGPGAAATATKSQARTSQQSKLQK